MRRAIVASGLALVLAGCARETGPVVRVGSIGPDTLEGEVRRVGSLPFTEARIETEAGQSVLVTGPYEAEIERLAGAIVRVTGRRVRGDRSEPSLEASSYEVLSIEGDRPDVGFLERDEAGFYLRRTGGDIRRLGVVSDPLAERVGALVWAVVDERDGVARYGILREPPP